jgi:tetratricopeptide (TPR) repeat protein
LEELESWGLTGKIGETYMEPLLPPASHFVVAAQGWLELGNPREALRELGQVPRPFWNHPDVLDLRWQIHAFEQNWERALMVARELVHTAPARPDAWLHHAYALRRVAGGGLKAAWKALQPALKAFPTEEMIPYNLSCYACQLNELAEAKKLFETAIAVGKKDELKKRALSDSDLKPLWPVISRM